MGRSVETVRMVGQHMSLVRDPSLEVLAPSPLVATACSPWEIDTQGGCW